MENNASSVDVDQCILPWAIGPIRCRVALTVIKLRMDTKQLIARFEAERQAWREVKTSLFKEH